MIDVTENIEAVVREDPVTIDQIKTYIMWVFILKLAEVEEEERKDLIYWFLASIEADAVDSPKDKYPAPYWAITELLQKSNDTTLHAVAHLIVGIGKWLPSERDLLRLCGASELL